jgi:hypothetical protein
MSFRQWLQQRWYDHCNEFEGWHRRSPDYNLKDYFDRYKYWLKREYRYYQKSNTQVVD